MLKIVLSKNGILPEKKRRRFTKIFYFQGLFILMFFTCSKKVVNSVKERLCGQAEVSTWQWSSRFKDQVDSQVNTDNSLVVSHEISTWQ
jgi:hypothetical protein